MSEVSLIGGRVLDANVLIRYLDSNHEHHRAAVEMLAEMAGEQFVLNDLTLAEVIVAPIRTNKVEQVLKVLKVDLGIQIAGYSGEQWAIEIATIRAASVPTLKTPDAVVVATAKAIRGKVASFDERVNQVAESLGLL